MTELEHLQSVILMIAKDIDKLCRENGIEYYLLGGSCIGAVRHHGFIPWDDDLDIIMTRKNYDRFIKVCRTKLDNNKYSLQIGGEDWPLNFSKIRLRGTKLHEPEDEYANDEQHGIYVDVFFVDNASDGAISSRIQYILAKYDLCYRLGERRYRSTTMKKKLMIALAAPMKIKAVRNLVRKYINAWSEKDTKRFGFYYGITRWRNVMISKDIYGKPVYVDFEDTKLPVPEHWHEYLTVMFGDYMKLPPVEQRVSHHLLSVDFGKY